MDSDVAARYVQKVQDFCDGKDPHILPAGKAPLPRNVGYFDVCNYLIEKDSSYIREAFKAYKSLQAYQYFENGLVQSVECTRIKTGFVVVAKVKHSYRLNLKSLQCWVSADTNGIILTAHCECMAGLGEVCTHVGAVLFVLEAGNRKSASIDFADTISCTDVLAKWLVPKMKEVEMASVDNINWSPSPGAAADECLNDTSIIIDETFNMEDSLSLTLPATNFEDIQSEIDNFLHTIKAIKTRDQSSCVLWFRFRAGRVTGSVFKAVCRTSLLTPSLSTIQKICFPEKYIFKNKTTEYGKQNEATALNTFFKKMRTQHVDYKMNTTGLIINNKYPFCGVSPDAVVSCNCCGSGVVEIKCPYLMRFGDMKPYLKKKDCPLIIRDETEGTYDLRRDHEYYYQVQMEIFLAEVDYCDSVIWCKDSLIQIRVFKDVEFWKEKYEIASKFFKKVLIPELYSCYFTRMVKQQK